MSCSVFSNVPLRVKESFEWWGFFWLICWSREGNRRNLIQHVSYTIVKDKRHQRRKVLMIHTQVWYVSLFFFAYTIFYIMTSACVCYVICYVVCANSHPHLRQRFASQPGSRDLWCNPNLRQYIEDSLKPRSKVQWTFWSIVHGTLKCYIHRVNIKK